MNQPESAAALRTTRSTPSAPSPARRSHSRATSRAERSSSPSGSGRITKSFSAPCPFANRMAPSLGNRGKSGIPQIWPRGVEPDHAGIAAEPRLLPPSEAPRRPDGLIARPKLRPLAGERPQHLRIAEGAARRCARAQPCGLQAAHLIDETGAPHSLDPGHDAFIELFPWQAKADLHGRVDRLIARPPRFEAPPRDLDHLERADNPAPVARQDRCGGGPVKPGQPLVQDRGAKLGKLSLQPTAHQRLGGLEAEVVQRRTHVEAGAADKHGHLATGEYLVDAGSCQPLILGHAGSLPNVPDVKKVVRHAGALGGAELGGADVHAAVE